MHNYTDNCTPYIFLCSWIGIRVRLSTVGRLVNWPNLEAVRMIYGAVWSIWRRLAFVEVYDVLG